MNRYEKLGKNIGLITIGSASSKLLNFLLLPLYTNILTSGEYGISDLIFTIVGLALPFFLCVIYEPLMR
ncbi:MAG: multidrug transporter, partial [Clostridia bacterium]|nr:multidrug transporter [Clostridia bacterium]